MKVLKWIKDCLMIMTNNGTIPKRKTEKNSSTICECRGSMGIIKENKEQ